MPEYFIDVRATRGGYMATVSVRTGKGKAVKHRLGTRYATRHIAEADARAWVWEDKNGVPH